MVQTYIGPAVGRETRGETREAEIQKVKGAWSVKEKVRERSTHKL